MEELKTTPTDVISPAATRTTSHASGAGLFPRRKKPTEFLLPDGRRILVALPEDVEALRRKYASTVAAGGQVEVVVHGSEEHQAHLRTSHLHHAQRREALRRQFGADFDEWERVQGELDAVSAQLDRLADHGASLGHNFSKFGYSAHLRTYGGSSNGGGGGSGSGSGDDDDGSGGGAATPRSRTGSLGGDGDSISTAVASWDDRRGGTTMKLFKRPVIKQYFHRGLLWRASEETTVLSFELFFDLLYVGIIAINGDHASEEANGHELLRFVVTFGMSWKIWTDLAQFISWFESDDIAQRLEFLFLIACLLGLTTNMLQTFNEEADTYVQLVAFYLAARLFTAAYCILICFLLPLVRGMMISQFITILLGAGLWIGSIYVEAPDKYALIFIALAIDLFGGSLIVGLYRYSRSHVGGLSAKLGKFFEFYPAINIEHKVERTNAFVTLVLGYSVVGVIYQNQGFGINAFLGKAVLGLVQAFIFNWLYFEVDGTNIHVHAIRRTVFTAFLWQYAHLIFVMSYILSAAALSRLVLAADCANAPAETLTELYHERSAEEVALGLRLYYGVGLGISMFGMFLISLSHTHKLPPQCRLPKWVRLSNRLAVSVIFCALPAAQDISSLSLIAITTSLTVWVLLVEIWGKSCTDDSFWGDKNDCCYTARCTKKELDSALKDGDVDVNFLSRREKRGAALID